MAGGSIHFTATGCFLSGNRSTNTTMSQAGILIAGQGNAEILGNEYYDLQYGNSIGGSAANVDIGKNLYVSVEQENVVTTTNPSTVQIASDKGSWSTSVVKTLTGGAATETVDVTIPAGVFTGDPSSATLTVESGTTFYLAIFQQTDAATTAINARFLISRPDGATITAGSVRFGVTVHA